MSPHELIAAALRRESAPWPADATEPLESAVLAAAADDGVMALLATVPAVAAWPEGIRSAFREELRVEAALEAIRRQELTGLLADLGAAGVRTLLLKGAHLAYTHYPRPWLRPRVDTDLLVAPGERARADAVLRGRGYRSRTHFNGDLVTHQFQYERPNRYGFTDLVDLHWKVANPQVFAGAFTFDELERDATLIALLGETAKGLSDVHAFILACVHRVAHHDNSDRLIWLYDIHLLASALGQAQLEEVAAAGAAKRLRSVCARGLTHAQARFATPVPGAWIDRLRPTSAGSEPSEAFLQNGRTKIDVLLSDLRELGGWRRRLQLIREHLFPPLEYVRHTYGVSHPALLRLAYAYRIATGVRKWFWRN